MKATDMEKIIGAIKDLIQPKEKEGNHLDLHVQVNKLFGLIADELQNLHDKNNELVEIVANANQNVNNISDKMDSVKNGINKVISDEIKGMKEYMQEKIQVDSFIMNYNGMISTDSESSYELEPIIPKLQAPYRMEIVAIRKSKGNDNLAQAVLPGIQNFEGEVNPIIHITSKGGTAVFEYDFDVLVTKL